jgi:hypothetical protein
MKEPSLNHNEPASKTTSIQPLILISFPGIKMPAYNAVAIFFGIGQTRLPAEHFSRFIWLLFIWFCLIFRTCWQSKMFEFMTTDMRKPLPASIDDLREMNYTIVLMTSYMMEFHRFNDEIINGRDR